ncbi:MAG: type II toxin-antitoxin system Phd/YefM family antitoxin [Chloroflexota bacterium]|nr:type II toxin-antitoxin system Phd/YefM family antitoxin [Chloroflexota bacterium]
MTRTVSATEVRVHFGELMRRVVEGQEPVVVERGGKPQVVVVSVEEYERLRGERIEREDWWERARRSRERVARELNGRPFPDITELIHEMREERDAQILGNLR